MSFHRYRSVGKLLGLILLVVLVSPALALPPSEVDALHRLIIAWPRLESPAWRWNLSQVQDACSLTKAAFKGLGCSSKADEHVVSLQFSGSQSTGDPVQFPDMFGELPRLKTLYVTKKRIEPLFIVAFALACLLTRPFSVV